MTINDYIQKLKSNETIGRIKLENNKIKFIRQLALNDGYGFYDLKLNAIYPSGMAVEESVPINIDNVNELKLTGEELDLFHSLNITKVHLFITEFDEDLLMLCCEFEEDDNCNCNLEDVYLKANEILNYECNDIEKYLIDQSIIDLYKNKTEFISLD